MKDNHKPEFQDCASYKPHVEEERPRGTLVIQVNLFNFYVFLHYKTFFVGCGC